MNNDSEKQLVIFKIGDEEFGVDIFEVREIIKHEEMTHVPEAKEYVEGIINLRGNVITLIDLAKKLQLDSKQDTKDTRTIVIEAKNTQIGMRVDEVVRVMKIPKEKITPPPKTITDKIHDDFIEGVAVINETPIIILDLARVFEEDELHKFDEDGKKIKIEEQKNETKNNVAEEKVENIKEDLRDEIKEEQKQDAQKEIKDTTKTDADEKKDEPEKKEEKPKPKPKAKLKKITKKKTLKKSDEGFHFITIKGDELKDAKDLHNYVKTLNDDEFKQFVTEDKNDFYNWLKYAVKDNDLADKVKKLKTKQDVTQTLAEHIKDLI
ncbi:MAG: chemotaxis protein CheW [Candidatus Woesearchaeota archaeon]